MIHHFIFFCVKKALQKHFRSTKKAEAVSRFSLIFIFLFVCFNQTILAIVTFVYDAGSICF